MNNNNKLICYNLSMLSALDVRNTDRQFIAKFYDEHFKSYTCNFNACSSK